MSLFEIIQAALVLGCLIGGVVAELRGPRLSAEEETKLGYRS